MKYQTQKERRLWAGVVNKRLAAKIESRQNWINELQELAPGKSLEELKEGKYFFDVSAIELYSKEIRDLRKEYERVAVAI